LQLTGRFLPCAFGRGRPKPAVRVLASRSPGPRARAGVLQVGSRARLERGNRGLSL